MYSISRNNYWHINTLLSLSVHWLQKVTSYLVDMFIGSAILNFYKFTNKEDHMFGLIYKDNKHICYPFDYDVTWNVGVRHHCVACQQKYEYLAEPKLVLKNTVIQNYKSLLFFSKDILSLGPLKRLKLYSSPFRLQFVLQLVWPLVLFLLMKFTINTIILDPVHISERPGLTGFEGRDTTFYSCSSSCTRRPILTTQG